MADFRYHFVMITDLPTNPDPDEDLLRGDRAAREGRWHDAITSWEQSTIHSSALRPLVASRLQWLLARQKPARMDLSGDVLNPMCFSLAAAFGVVSLVMLARDPGTTPANLLAIGAWMLVAVSIVTSVIAARRIDNVQANESFDLRQLVGRARIYANKLDEPRELEHLGP